jgi:HK97 gp10 family phage protein
MELSISIGNNVLGSRKIGGFTEALPANLRKGFQTAGALFERDMKAKLSGPGRTAHSTAGPFSRLNNFPGVRTGRLRASVSAQLTGSGTALTLRVGPNTEYAPYLEFGTSRMPSYAFVRPTLEDNGDRALDMIANEILGPLDEQ